MARKPEPTVERPRLNKPRSVALSEIEARIKLGTELLARRILNEHELDAFDAEFDKWNVYNRELLLALFNNETVAIEYKRWGAASIPMHPSFAEKIERRQDKVREKITRLESIRERLGLFEEPAASRPAAVPKAKELSRRVFVVHGHDELVKAEVARLLERLDFEPVILHEQPNRGRTIIEKFENHSDVGFAIVLLTPDDVGARAVVAPATPDLVRRARQNVVFEFGFFVGKLGRDRVAALFKNGTEILSDISGVAYTQVDAGGAWKLEIAKELRAAGYEVDFDKIT